MLLPFTLFFFVVVVLILQGLRPVRLAKTSHVKLLGRATPDSEPII